MVHISRFHTGICAFFDSFGTGMVCGMKVVCHLNRLLRSLFDSLAVVWYKANTTDKRMFALALALAFAFAFACAFAIAYAFARAF